MTIRILIMTGLILLISNTLLAQKKRIDIDKSDTLIFKNRLDTLLISTDIEKISYFINYISDNAVKDKKGENYKSFNFIYFHSSNTTFKTQIEIFGDGFRYKGKRYKVTNLREEFRNTFNYYSEIK